MDLHAYRLPEATGAFRVIEEGGRSYILVRDAQGRPRCFLNQCRHRGARLENRESGVTRVFVCPYHAWSYDTNGTLRNLPYKECFTELDFTELNLIETADFAEREAPASAKEPA